MKILAKPIYRLLPALLLFFSSIAYAGNNDIYITQTGAGLTMTIDQVGATNTIGTTGTRAILSGASMVFDAKQTGSTNSVIASILQGASSSWTYHATGDSNVATFAVGASGAATSTDFDYSQTGGNSNVLLWTQGAASAATAGNADFVIQGGTNNINTTCEVIGCIQNWNIDGDGNDIDVTQTGNADKSITATLTGSTNDIDIDQTSATTGTTDVLNIVSTTSNGTIDVDQCSSGC
tara:strand:+ start:65 stop:772 length:708 start_codon:yes stop_codon:yes gene_type:complete